MNLIPWQVPAGLAVALALSGLGNYTLWQRAKAADASAQPLRDAATSAAALADGYRTALQTCEADKLAMRKANERAVGEAIRDRDEAQRQAEEYLQRLSDPPAGCEAITQARVCPKLMDY